MSPLPLVSVCILAGHGTTALDACLQSLRAQSSPPSFEVLVGGDRPSRVVMSTVHRHFPHSQVCDTGLRLPGAARNPLIERARGELLLFLDDDVTAPPDLLSRLARVAAEHPEVSVFGGPNQTPARSSRFQVVQGAVLSSLMGSGPVSRRYGARHAGPADERWFTLCNLAVRRTAMIPLASYLVCAEENALLAELRARGERMRYEPRLGVFHVRRATLPLFGKQMFKYGRGRGELLRDRPSTARAAYLAPVALLLYLLILLVMVIMRADSGLALLPAGTYLTLTCASALRIGWTLQRLADVPLAAVLTVAVHICYGGGVLRGVLLPGHARDDAAARWKSGEDPLTSRA